MEALEKAKEYEPDILLVDICMPKLSGIKFLEELKKLSIECKVIIISGLMSLRMHSRLLPWGCLIIF